MTAGSKQEKVNTMPGFVRASEYARRKGFDRSYLSKADVQARLAPALRRDGRAVFIDPVLADEILRRETDTAKVRKDRAVAEAAASSDGDDEFEDAGSLDAHRRENVRLKNEDLAMKIAAQKGQTVARDGVVAAAARYGQMVREACAARNHRLADKLGKMTDPRQIRLLLDDSDRQAFEMVSDDFKRRIQKLTGGNESTTH